LYCNGELVVYERIKIAKRKEKKEKS
jgi:hypothetical protein